MKGALLEGIIVIAIILASTTIVLNVINPAIDEGKSYQRFNEARQTMNAIDAAIRNVLYEAPGSRRTVQVNLRDSHLIVSGKDDEIRMEIPGVSLLEPGSQTKEGNVRIISGPWLTATEQDIDNDATTDLVLENEAIIFAVKKIGTPSSYATVNTSSLISLISNKLASVNVTPVSGIMIDGDRASLTGTGYTELSKTGTSLQSASVHVYMNSTATGVSYEALFTLRAGADFVELEVKRVS
ncbi:MAG: hypothetical protein HY832_00815 [Candidatus Aenigmarchaeota archaeon]|nr:hypothetical protein [Candidatus Aenigmarchaeota archaeon]